MPTTATSPSRAVTSDDIRPYIPLVEILASRLAATRRARQAGAEYDDLYQEGLNAVWQGLLRGVSPEKTITPRMKDWIRFQLRLKRNDGIAYGRILPLELGNPARERE